MKVKINDWVRITDGEGNHNICTVIEEADTLVIFKKDCVWIPINNIQEWENEGLQFTNWEPIENETCLFHNTRRNLTVLGTFKWTDSSNYYTNELNDEEFSFDRVQPYLCLEYKW